jgi:uroporphyrinogen-III synthase
MPQSLRILVTRPREDGEKIAARLAEMGHQAVLSPLLTPQFQDGPDPLSPGLQAALATSANGVRALARRTSRRDVTIFAVGPQTTAEARAAGFTNVRNADGDAVLLADAVLRWADPQGGALLHVCGEEASGALAAMLAARGFAVERAVLYRVEAAKALPPEIRAALRDGALDAAMFFSPRSARLFCDLATGLTAGLTALCISPATAAALTAPFIQCRVAAAPNQDALLALVE